MAYQGSNLILIAGSIEGSVNFFSYVTSDSFSAVLAANYFSDGIERGMQIGDLVFVIASGIGYVCYVSGIHALSATIEAAALAILDGSQFPVNNPGPGSGLVWNNNGFLCVS